MIEPRRHGHPMVKAAVGVAAVVLVGLLALSVVSILVGFVWTIVKLALLVAVVGGVWHLLRHRKHSASGSFPR